MEEGKEEGGEIRDYIESCGKKHVFLTKLFLTSWREKSFFAISAASSFVSISEAKTFLTRLFPSCQPRPRPTMAQDTLGIGQKNIPLSHELRSEGVSE